MVIISTRATEVSIHAVSPPEGVQFVMTAGTAGTAAYLSVASIAATAAAQAGVGGRSRLGGGRRGRRRASRRRRGRCGGRVVRPRRGGSGEADQGGYRQRRR